MNKFFISGKLNEKPELKYSDEGKEFCILDILNIYKKKKYFLKIGVFGENAKKISDSLDKGDKVLATCFIKNHSYTSVKPCKCKHFTNSIIAESVELLAKLKKEEDENQVVFCEIF